MNNIIEYMKTAHIGQKRKDNITPYHTHPLAVMESIKMAGINNETILAAALLHDVIEDTPTNIDDMRTFLRSNNNINADITYQAVLELTNINKLYNTFRDIKTNRSAKKALMNEQFERFAGPVSCIVKVFDRLHNIQDVNTIGDNNFIEVYKNETKALLIALKCGINRNIKFSPELKTELDIALMYCDKIAKLL